MASIPALGTHWRCRDTGDVVEVEFLKAPGPYTQRWTVIAFPGPHGAQKLIADAHWFCTEGYEYVAEADGG